MINTTFADFFGDDQQEFDISDENSTIAYLKKCSEAYYTEGEQPLISDQEYDRIYESAKSSWPDNEFFENVGSEPVGKNKVQHEFILGSLTKFKSENISDFLTKLNSNGDLYILPKYDGLSIYAEYNNGNLVKASTRGNGTVGIDITSKAKEFCPKISDNRRLKLRGEILLIGDSYKTFGFANRRNGASGVIGQKNPDKSQLKELHVIWYEVLEPNILLEDGLNLLNSAYIKINVKEFKSPERIFEYFKEEFSDVDLDGLVLAYDGPDEPYIRQNVYYPTNKICWKPETETAIATIKEIEWTTSRTGRVVPVAIFQEPVQLDGTLVSRATCYNAKFVLDNKLSSGKKVELCKANYIIPRIKKVL